MNKKGQYIRQHSYLTLKTLERHLKIPECARLLPQLGLVGLQLVRECVPACGGSGQRLGEVGGCFVSLLTGLTVRQTRLLHLINNKNLQIKRKNRITQPSEVEFKHRKIDAPGRFRRKSRGIENGIQASNINAAGKSRGMEWNKSVIMRSLTTGTNPGE